jgi:hypothetical protein
MSTMKASKPRKWFVRKIKDGAVRIVGVTYRPKGDHLSYDGRLDGLRMIFARYFTGNTVEPFVSLWGTEEQRDAPYGGLVPPGPQCVDGHFPWDFWYPESVSHV